MIAVALVLRGGRLGGLSWSSLAGRLAVSADACAAVEHLFVAPCDEPTSGPHGLDGLDGPADAEVEVQAVLYVQRLDTAAAVAVAVEVARPLVEAGALLRTAVPSPW